MTSDPMPNPEPASGETRMTGEEALHVLALMAGASEAYAHAKASGRYTPEHLLPDPGQQAKILRQTITDLRAALTQANEERDVLLEMLDAHNGQWVPSSRYTAIQIACAQTGCWKPWRQVGSLGYIWEAVNHPRDTPNHGSTSASPYDASKGGLSDLR